jgi:hypothetical protein
MLKPFLKPLIPTCLILLVFPVSTLAFPDFSYMTKGGVSLEQGDMRLGRIQLHPGLAFESNYESNILNTADDTFANGTVEEPTDDFIFTIKPSMRVELDRAKGEIFGFYVDYLGRDENFLNEGGSLSFFNHLIQGGINLGGPGGRGDVTIGGSWNKEAGGANRDINSNIGNRQATTTSIGFVELLYSLSKILKLQIRADVIDEKFRGVATQNSDEYNLGGSLFWQATTPAAFGVKYNHKIRSYQIPTRSNDDSDSDQVFLAMKWTPTSLITSEIAVGFDSKRFEIFEGEDSLDLVYQLDVTYTPVKRTRITLHAGREIPDSSFAGIQSLILSTFRLGLSQQLGKKFTLLVDLSLDNSDYRRSSLDSSSPGGLTKTRVDNTVYGSTALVYQIQKWLDAKARYQYEENISNFNSSDYINHTGTLEIAAK